LRRRRRRRRKKTGIVERGGGRAWTTKTTIESGKAPSTMGATTSCDETTKTGALRIFNVAPAAFTNDPWV
jgi:hypothetical protein